MPPVDLTVREYMATWLESLGAEELSPGTLVVYGVHVRRIDAYLGHVPLQKLTARRTVLAARMAAK